jgi:hypothetical protein
MNKNLVVLVVIALLVCSFGSACSFKVGGTTINTAVLTAGNNACGDITGCVNNTGAAMVGQPCLVGTRGADGNCY